ncbi:hypothetical protein OT109_13920 [Phycisphaeraceae bacterium D3-23]
MKSHDLAKILIHLSDILYAGPNTDLADLKTGSIKSSRTTDRDNKPDLAINLHTLATLSKVDKSEWIEFSERFHLPITIRPRDASRDIIGKLLTYLDNNPAEHKRIAESSRPESSEGSPELLRALSVLLGDKNK